MRVFKLFGGRLRATFLFLVLAILPALVHAEIVKIVALPDTQVYAQNYPEIFDNQTLWIVDNKDSIDFVVHLGDIVEVADNETQWQNANHSMSYLNGNVKWVALPGNHDFKDSDNYWFDKYFGYQVNFSWVVSHYGIYGDNEAENTISVFYAEGYKFVVVALQYCPTGDILQWANNTLSQYEENAVIIVATHSYLNTDGTRTGCGDTIWNNFVKYHNVSLVICGHVPGEGFRQDENVYGYTVYQRLADYQSQENGGNGKLQIITFDFSNEKLKIETYSPYTDSYETDSDSYYELTWEPPEPSYGTSNWQYRRAITITEQSGSTLTDYQLAINVTYDSDMQPDFDDLRFKWLNESSNEEIEIPYWIESKVDSNWAYVWIKVPEIPANDNATVYMYYGNPTATSASNGTAVFEFFDGFEDGDVSDWSVDNQQ